MVRRRKLLFAHSNHDAVWKEIHQACDPKTASNSVMLVADQESINRVLDGQPRASLKLKDDHDKQDKSFLTIV